MTTEEIKNQSDDNEQKKESVDVSKNSKKLEDLQSELITERLNDVQVKVSKTDVDKSMLDKKSDYLRNQSELQQALSNVMVNVVQKIWSSENLKTLLSNMKITNFTDQDVKNTYDFLSRGDIDGKDFSKTEAKAFQLLLAKASQQLENIMKENSKAEKWADGMIWTKTLDAINLFTQWLLNMTSRNNIPMMNLSSRDLQPLENKIQAELVKISRIVETKEIGWVRLEAHTKINFGKKLNLQEMANVLAMYYEQINYDNLDPSVSFDVKWDNRKVGLVSRDKKREIKFDEDGSKLWIYWDTWSLHLKNPDSFKGSVLDWTLDVKRYEDRPNWEARQVEVKNRSDIENMKTWKWDAFSKAKINEINLVWWALKINWELTLEDAKTVSNAMEKEFEGLDNWYDRFWELKTAADFTKRYSDGKQFLDKIADANRNYWDKIDYKNVSIVLDPYKLSNMFEATGIFKWWLSVVQDLFGSIWPVEMKGNELKELIDLVGVSIDVGKYWSVETDKASRKLLDIAVNKFTGSKDLNNLIDKSISKSQFQLDTQKTLAVHEWMYNMMKNGEQFVMLWELAQNKSGLALLRLNNIENNKTGAFAFVEHSQNDVFVTPFRNYYNHASIGLENVSETSVWAWVTRELYNKNWLKISWDALVKYMNISGMNTGNVIINVPSGELPIGEVAQSLGYKSQDLGQINTWNAYVWMKLEKQGLNYWIDASLWVMWTIKKTLTDSFKINSWIWVRPLFDANGYYKPTDSTLLKGNLTTDFKHNTYWNVSAEKQFNSKISAGGFVWNDWVLPVWQNNELTKFGWMNPNNRIEGWAFGTYRPNEDTKFDAYATNQRTGINAQKTFYTAKGAEVTGFAWAGVDYAGKGKIAPTVEAWVRMTTDQVTKIVKNTWKKTKDLFK